MIIIEDRLRLEPTICLIPRARLTMPRPADVTNTLRGHLLLGRDLSGHNCFDLYNLSLRALVRESVLMV